MDTEDKPGDPQSQLDERRQEKEKEKEKPTKSSFSLTQRSREAIRRVSEHYHVKQSEIMNYAPLLFAIVAEKSLEERRHKLNAVTALSGQIQRHCNEIERRAPHLGTAVAATCARHRQLALLEEESIASRAIHGPSKGEMAKLGEGTGEAGDADPFLRTVQTMVTQLDTQFVGDVSIADYDGQPLFRCCSEKDEAEIAEEFSKGDLFPDDVEKVLKAEMTLDEFRDEAAFIRDFLSDVDD